MYLNRETITFYVTYAQEFNTITFYVTYEQEFNTITFYVTYEQEFNKVTWLIHSCVQFIVDSLMRSNGKYISLRNNTVFCILLSSNVK
jgi:hypothetical protein